MKIETNALYKVIECIFGFETGDGAMLKSLKVLGGIAQALFWIAFLAYCTYPAWSIWLNK